MSYHDSIHTVMTLRREQGVAAALTEACSSSTVFIPLAVAALLPVSIEPSRVIGVWIQVGELGLLLWSFFYFVWNQDAAASLSWQQSLTHVAFVGNHIGMPVFYFVLAYHTAWVAHNHINRYSVRLRERLLTSGQFVKVSDEITNQTEETVTVYRNARLTRVAAAKRSRL